MEELCRLCGKSEENMIRLSEAKHLIEKIFDCTTIMVRVSIIQSLQANL